MVQMNFYSISKAVNNKTAVSMDNKQAGIAKSMLKTNLTKNRVLRNVAKVNMIILTFRNFSNVDCQMKIKYKMPKPQKSLSLFLSLSHAYYAVLGLGVVQNTSFALKSSNGSNQSVGILTLLITSKTITISLIITTDKFISQH